jgi:hypothetical protein
MVWRRVLIGMGIVCTSVSKPDIRFVRAFPTDIASRECHQLMLAELIQHDIANFRGVIQRQLLIRSRIRHRIGTNYTAQTTRQHPVPIVKKDAAAA